MWFSFGDGFKSRLNIVLYQSNNEPVIWKIWNEKKEEEEAGQTIGRKFLTIYFYAFEKKPRASTRYLLFYGIVIVVIAVGENHNILYNIYAA